VLTDLTDRLLIYLISADTTDTSHALKGKIIYPTVNDAKLGVNLARCDEEDIQKGYALPDHMLEEYFRRLYESCNQHPRIIYEYANVLDYLGREGEAIPLYMEALSKGISGELRKSCLIQLGSSLRVVGELEKSRQVLLNVYKDSGEPASLLFLTLTLHDMGKDLEALCTLSESLLGKEEGLISNYRRALTNYLHQICLR